MYALHELRAEAQHLGPAVRFALALLVAAVDTRRALASSGPGKEAHRVKILVLLVHADPSVRAKYEAAAGPDVTVLPIVRPGLSSTYAALASECRGRGQGSAIRGLLSLHRVAAESFDAILLVTYSAGYAFARALTAADREMLAGLVLLDSAHAALDQDGTAADAGPAGVGWLLDWAAEARAGRKVLSLGHTDVPTHGYASTTAVAREVERLSGGELGEFTIRAFNLRPPSQAMLEHADALTVWGPGFVAQAVERVRRRLPAPEPAKPAPRPTTVNAADVARRYVDSGLKEIPGPQHDKTIQRMLGGCRRGGSPRAGMGKDATGYVTLGLYAPDETEWCCAFASTCEAESGGDHDTAPHGFRAACWEIIQDAMRLNTWRDVSSGYVPKRGESGALPPGRSGPPASSGRRGTSPSSRPAPTGRSSASTATAPTGRARSCAGPTIRRSSATSWAATSRRTCPRPIRRPPPRFDELRLDDLAVAVDRMSREALDQDRRRPHASAA